MSALPGRLGLLALGLVGAFTAGEAGVRLLLQLGLVEGEAQAAFPQVGHPVEFRPSRNSRLQWELDPHHPSTNAHGFRDRERSHEKAAGTMRIGVLGDSVTLGRGVALEAAHPAVLDAFRGREARDLRLLPNDTVHLNAEGLRLAARAIRDHLEASGELERLRRRAGGYTPAP